MFYLKTLMLLIQSNKFNEVLFFTFFLSFFFITHQCHGSQ